MVITACEQRLNNALNPLTIIQNGTAQVGSKLGLRRTQIFFYGDTYINRFTEKNNMFMFYYWLFDQPDGYEFDYTQRAMIGFPRFWVNSISFDVSNFLNV